MDLRKSEHTVISGKIHVATQIFTRFKELASYDTSFVVVEACERDGLASGAPERDRHASVHDSSARASVEYSLAICFGNSSSVSRGRPEATDGGRHIPVGNGDAATKRPEEYSGGVNELLVGQSELEAAGEEELKLGFWRRWIGIGIGVPMGGRPCATGILARTSLINGHNRTMDTTIKERHLSVVPAKRMD